MIKRSAALLLCTMLVLLCALPAAAPAEGGAKVVRVGWYETPFNRKDAFGRRTGYAYEYQRKIAAYTGWKYEYVEGNWSELLQMLKDGRIDLMSDVSYTEERSEYMLFSGIPMGSELYYLYVAPGRKDITVEDPSALNGKRVGVTKSSLQCSLFLDWASARGISADLAEMECSEEESLAKLDAGELDAFVTLDTYGDPLAAVPLWKIGSSDFYFAVSSERPDLLADLDAALSRIQDENKLYSEQLSAKYLRNAATNRYLTADEQEWLEGHGPIRVGFQDNYLAFCAADPSTGELTGALKDWLSIASGVLENASPAFTSVVYPTAAAAIEALKSGDVDCMFPANLTDYDGEVEGLVMTPALMRTEMDAVVRAEDKQNFLRKSQVRVGVNQGNPNYEMFLREHYPGWTPVLYNDTPACLDAVAAKNADCIIISNYRFGNISRQCEKLNLTTVYTGVDMDYCFAVREGSTTLYSILSKIIGQVPGAAVNASLTYYSSETTQTGLIGYIVDHPLIAALAVFCVTQLLIVLILLRRFSPSKKSGEDAPRTPEQT